MLDKGDAHGVVYGRVSSPFSRIVKWKIRYCKGKTAPRSWGMCVAGTDEPIMQKANFERHLGINCHGVKNMRIFQISTTKCPFQNIKRQINVILIAITTVQVRN